MRGMDDVHEVVLPVEDTEAECAVHEYQPQGVACFEVVFRTGVPVREAPDQSAKVLSTRKMGEYVFAKSQNFDGWVGLAGEDGWMLAATPDWGQLLRLRTVCMYVYIYIYICMYVYTYIYLYIYIERER